jgi:hypothetical protein
MASSPLVSRPHAHLKGWRAFYLVLTWADPALRPSPRNPKFVLPIEEQGIKCLSFGYVNSQAGVPGAGGQVRPRHRSNSGPSCQASRSGEADLRPSSQWVKTALSDGLWFVESGGSGVARPHGE